MSHNNESLLRETLDLLPFVVIITDPFGQILYANRAFTEFTGKDHKNFEIIHSLIGDGFSCKHRHDHPLVCGYGEHCQKECGFRKAINNAGNGKEYNDQEVIFHREGEETPLYFKIRVIPKTHEENNQYTIFLENKTQEKKLIEVTLSKQKLEGVMLTAGAICHEINNPLSIAFAYLEKAKKDKQDCAHLDQVMKQLEKMAQITKHLSHIVQLETKDYTDNTQILDIKKSSEEKR